jgi:ferritin-like metal-binding protein YciE
MQISSFSEMYITELQELADAEAQVTEALLAMAHVASRPSLKNLLRQHQGEADIQLERLLAILEKHGASTDAHVDQAMEALLHETDKMLTLLDGDELRDVGLITSAQKLKHYEIAAFGSAAAMAGQLDLRDDQELLHECLEEEKRCDAALTSLAKGEVNPGALAA